MPMADDNNEPRNLLWAGQAPQSFAKSLQRDDNLIERPKQILRLVAIVGHGHLCLPLSCAWNLSFLISPSYRFQPRVELRQSGAVRVLGHEHTKLSNFRKRASRGLSGLPPQFP